MKTLLKRKLAAILFKLSQWEEQYHLQKRLNNSNIQYGKDIIIGKYFSLDLPDDNYSFIINDNVIIRKFCNIIIHQNATLIFGKNVFFNNYCSINCLCKILVGENTLFGEGVKIYDHSHKYSYNNDLLTVERKDFNIDEINIGKNVWIGSNTTILKGVTIGDNTIVGANNLIFKSIPSNTIIKAKTDILIDYFEEDKQENSLYNDK